LNVGPVIPGVAACAVATSRSATTAARSNLVIEIDFVIFVALIAALLIADTIGDAVADVHLGHETAEIFFGV
jgi:hypothetical protein